MNQICDWCGDPCSPAIGMYREMKIVQWGGGKGQESVSYLPKLLSFFCSDQHRLNYLVEP